MAHHSHTVVARPPFALAFTGSRRPLAGKQADALWRHLSDLCRHNERVLLHHGGCIEGDRTTHAMVRELWGDYPHSHITIHAAIGLPADLCDWTDADDLRAPLPTRERNENVVLGGQGGVVIACPADADEHSEASRRSGTWQAVRIAKRLLGGCLLITPDGEIRSEK